MLYFRKVNKEVKRKKMEESVKLERISQIAFMTVMAVIYAILGTILLLSGIAFLLEIKGIEILTFSGEMLPMTFLAIFDIALGIVVIIAAGAIAITGLRQKTAH